ncbi:TetR family transcriptional regulator [Aquabacterium soli]|uniref:TetR family transcriptional regulator n=1 Tax=Aquabacterium soli TaxID=2493092 RepID=A0A426VE22_9BURK|nr:TetR/AcrR family transcriptional regulator [Aquabacterium soli]RRS05099.1 TetR family transcriptional regulator [Aquabacterium soli]
MTAKRPRRTAERILDVTLAMFNRFGEPNVSTSQLCGELGISPGNLFYHHPTRDALVAGLFARYQADLEQALEVAATDTGAAAAPEEPTPGAPWWQEASPTLAHLAHLADALAHTAWVYRFLFRDLSDLVSRHRVLEEGLPPLLRRQAQALQLALRALPWRGPEVDDAALAVWAGHMLASLTNSTGLDGALDPREHLRQTGPHAVDMAVGRALGLLRPSLAEPDAQLLGRHLIQPTQLGMDPWWLAPAGG